MIIEKFKVHPGNKEKIEEDVVFPSSYFSKTSLLHGINKCHAKYEVVGLSESLLAIKIQVECEAILICSYSLEPFPYLIRSRDILTLTNDLDEESDDVIYDKSNTFDTIPHLFSLILAAVPISPKKKGAKLPKAGEGYEVFSEEEFEKKKDKELDPRLSKLDEIDFDD